MVLLKNFYTGVLNEILPPRDIVTNILLKYIGEDDIECANFAGYTNNNNTLKLHGVQQIAYDEKERVIALSFDFVPVCAYSFFFELAEGFMKVPTYSYQQYFDFLMFTCMNK